MIRMRKECPADHSAATRGHHDIELDPYGYRWYRVGGLDYILRPRSW